MELETSSEYLIRAIRVCEEDLMLATEDDREEIEETLEFFNCLSYLVAEGLAIGEFDCDGELCFTATEGTSLT